MKLIEIINQFENDKFILRYGEDYLPFQNSFCCKGSQTFVIGLLYFDTAHIFHSVKSIANDPHLQIKIYVIYVTIKFNDGNYAKLLKIYN
jgi:hypothetical protein